MLDHLGLGLEEQHGGTADGADVDRLERRIEDKHPALGPALGGLAPAPPVLVGRRGPHWCWWNLGGHARRLGQECRGRRTRPWALYVPFTPRGRSREREAPRSGPE